MTPTILLVEDDPRIATVTMKNLEASGFDCRHVSDGQTALRDMDRIAPALVVLDLNLPGMDGLEVTRRLRKTSRVPILMLTARDTEADKVLGLEVGADDYLTKPFGMRELVARVRALLRRSGAGDEAGTLTRGTLTIDLGRRLVEQSGRSVDLTSLEFDLLSFLARHPGRVYSRESLLDQVWGEDRVVDSRSIDSLVSRLRRKFTALPGGVDHIETVWGAGYRFREAVSRER